MKNAQKAAKKEAGQAAREAQEVTEPDYAEGKYGELPLNQSQTKLVREVIRVENVGLDHVQKSIWIRARLHNSRAKGKQCFVVLRQGRSTIQGLIAVDADKISKQMLKFVSK